jgi:hypothetical protein
MHHSVRVEALRRAREEVKAQIRREGWMRLSSVAPRDITAMAEAKVIADAEYRARLIAEPKRVVEQWHWGRAEDCPHSSTTTWKVGAARPREIQ